MKLEMRISRINNRLSLLNERCDNFISRENLGSVVQLEYEPCHKIYHFGILQNISLPNFIIHAKTWIKNILQLTISIEEINLLAMLNGTLLKVEDHFQTMADLRNVYYYKITPILSTNEFYPRYIPRKSLLTIDDNRRQLFKPPTGFHIYYFECVFKMDQRDDHKKKYNVMETWTLDEFIQKILEWFIQDCQLDRTKQYEIITLQRRILPLYNSSQRIKNILITHPNLFPAFYIREKAEVILNIPIPANIITIITPIITPIVPNMEECCVCLEMTPIIRTNQYFESCPHVLCSGCNYECIRTRNLRCPLCRGPRR